MSYFRLEHYLPARVIEKLDLSYIREELSKLHSTYVGAPEKETELEFLKVSYDASQRWLLSSHENHYRRL